MEASLCQTIKHCDVQLHTMFLYRSLTNEAEIAKFQCNTGPIMLIFET